MSEDGKSTIGELLLSDERQNHKALVSQKLKNAPYSQPLQRLAEKLNLKNKAFVYKYEWLDANPSTIENSMMDTSEKNNKLNRENNNNNNVNNANNSNQKNIEATKEDKFDANTICLSTVTIKTKKKKKSAIDKKASKIKTGTIDKSLNPYPSDASQSQDADSSELSAFTHWLNKKCPTPLSLTQSLHTQPRTSKLDTTSALPIGHDKLKSLLRSTIINGNPEDENSKAITETIEPKAIAPKATIAYNSEDEQLKANKGNINKEEIKESKEIIDKGIHNKEVSPKERHTNQNQQSLSAKGPTPSQKVSHPSHTTQQERAESITDKKADLVKSTKKPNPIAQTKQKSAKPKKPSTKGKNKKRTALQEKIKQSVKKKPEIASEALAKQYYKQGYFQDALDMYTQLSLKNPEKSGFFAPFIEKIKNELK